MIIHECKQGSPEWNRLRRGIPTASEFKNLVTPGGKPSKAVDDYLYRKLAERLGYIVESVSTAGLQYGHEQEPVAAATYEQIHDVEAREVGFVTTDDGQVGASPDRLVGEHGLLQIKCPFTPWTHLEYLADPQGFVQAHYPQIQGEMFVTERAWCDLVAYFPGLPMVTRRVEAEPKYQVMLAEALSSFVEKLTAMEKRVKSMPGYVPMEEQ